MNHPLMMRLSVIQSAAQSVTALEARVYAIAIPRRGLPQLHGLKCDGLTREENTDTHVDDRTILQKPHIRRPSPRPDDGPNDRAMLRDRSGRGATALGEHWRPVARRSLVCGTGESVEIAS